MKHKRLLGKLLLLLLSLSFVLGTAAACTTEVVLRLPSGQGTGTIPTNTIKLKTDPVTDYVGPGSEPWLPDLNLDRVFRVAVRKTTKDYVMGVDESADAVLQAIYDGNLEVGDRLGTEFRWTVWEGDWNDQLTFVNYIEKANASNTPYDLVVSQSLVASVLATRGLLRNLQDTKHNDLTAPWWPRTYLNHTNVNGQLYSVAMNCDCSVMDSAAVIFANNRLLEKAKLEHPLTYIANNEWTFVLLAEMTRAFDLPQTNPSDHMIRVWGYREASDEVNADWFLALGNHFIIPEEKGLVNSLEKYDFSHFLENITNFWNYNAVSIEPAESDLFFEERILFYKNTLSFAKELSSKAGLVQDYQILPMPKNRPDQKNFYTPIGNEHNVWMIPAALSHTDPDESSAVLEVLAYERYQCFPTYFESYIDDLTKEREANAVMFDLILDSITVDLAMMYPYVYTEATVRTPWKAMYDYQRGNLTGSAKEVYDIHAAYWQEVFEKIASFYNTEGK